MDDNSTSNMLAAANMLNQTATTAYSMANNQWQKNFAENERDYTRGWNEEQRDYNRQFIAEQQKYEREWQSNERDYQRALDDYNKAFAENDRDYTRAWNEEQRDYLRKLQETMFNREDNSYQRTVADLQAAGLSKALISGTNGAGSVLTQPSAASASQPSFRGSVGHSNVGAPSPISYSGRSNPPLSQITGVDILGIMNNGMNYSKSLSEKKRLANLASAEKLNYIAKWTDDVANNPFLRLETDGNNIKNIKTDVKGVEEYQNAMLNRLTWEEYAKQKKAEYVAEHPDGVSNYQMGQDAIELILNLLRYVRK